MAKVLATIAKNIKKYRDKLDISQDKLYGHKYKINHNFKTSAN